MQGKKKAIIVDIDGTLANAKHRVHHIEKKPRDWKAFFAEAHKDTPNRWCSWMVEAMYLRGVKIVFLTGRDDGQLEDTEKWLKGAFSTAVQYELLMRKLGDSRPDTEVKAEVYREQIEPKYDVLCAIDDRARVVKMWRSIGVPCLQCDDWEERTDPSYFQEMGQHFHGEKYVYEEK